MAAYSSVVSLLQILEQLQDSDQFSNIHYPKSQIHYLHDKVRSLKDFLENNSSVEDLETPIRDAACEAEDIIESQMSTHFLSSEIASFRKENNISISNQDFQRVIQKIDSIAERANEITDQARHDSTNRVSSRLSLYRSNQIVGREDDLIYLKDRLMKTEEGSTGLSVVPVVGISGIGKTFLAQTVYNDPEIAARFIIRAWVKVSLDYGKRDILLGLLRSMKKLGGGNRQETDDELAKRLSKFLKFVRYLVVLDDVCDLRAWNDLKDLFPNHNNGSRVMLTTRNMDVARFASSNGPFHQLRVLSHDESWVLLQMIVFRYKSCPPELEEIAKRIEMNCKGLPLAIVTIGRVLSEASTEDWQIAASSISTCETYGDLVEVVIALSYKSLPQYVKGCLLYMGIFPHNYEIPVSKLIKLWIAEGFLELMRPFLTLEEMAEECLLKLVNRRLVLVSEWSPSGRIKNCRIDEVYRDFFMRKAEEEKFFHVINKYTSGFPKDNYDQGRLCIRNQIHFGNKDESTNNSKASDSILRSLLFAGPQQHPLRVWLDFKLLRVLDALRIRFYHFPIDILKLVHLRFLALTYDGELPASICKLWNLQFLIVLRYLSTKHAGSLKHLPMEIWNMKELRHLQFMGRDLLDPSTAAGENEYGSDSLGLLENLLTLSDVSSHSCTPGVVQRIPNLKKLGIQIESPGLDAAENFSFLSHLVILRHLESLKCVVVHPDFGSQVVSSIPAFPPSLRKLSLSGCGFAWEHMVVIAALPNLAVLKLQNYAFQGPEWKLNNRVFMRLKFLLLEDTDIEHWEADSKNFPLLTSLIIRHCYKLRKIPHGIGDILTLKMIELVDGSQSAMSSAQEIQQEQLHKEYKDIQIDLQSSRDD